MTFTLPPQRGSHLTPGITRRPERLLEHNKLRVGGLVREGLVRLVIEGNHVVSEEHLLTERGQLISDVRQGPVGALYVVTDESDRELWKITPKR